MIPRPIEFWFDLTSPYAYFGGLGIDALAARHGRTVHWKPFLLGVVFRTTGSSPLTAQPLKGDYAVRDWRRLARLAEVAFVLRDDFPLRTHLAARMALAVEATAGVPTAGAFSRRLLGALFADGADIADPEVAAAQGVSIGLDREWLVAVSNGNEWREALRRRCEDAVARGICGSPWIMVDEEPFWGSDRLDMADRWLSTGGLVGSGSSPGRGRAVPGCGLLATAVLSGTRRERGMDGREHDSEGRYVLIVHEVEDYSKWKQVFDAAAGRRREAGEIEYQLFAFDRDARQIVHLRAGGRSTRRGTSSNRRGSSRSAVTRVW